VAASVALVVLAAAFVPGGHRLVGTSGRGWYVPGDLWGTQLAAAAVAHLRLGAVYGPGTGLITFPGIAVLLAPAVSLAQALGLPVQHGGPVTWPTGWLPLLGASLLVSLPALFGADALARALGVPRGRRFLLAGGEAVALWNVTVWWGHPEDALAVGLALFAALAVLEGRPARAAWLLGMAIAVQPLTLLLAPPLVARFGRTGRLANGLRLLAPSVLLLLPVFLAAPGPTFRSLSTQPNYPTVDHTTPWVLLSPRLGHQVVAAGPLRLAAVLLVAWFGWHASARMADPAALVWLLALCALVRVVLEPVMVAYYVWPVLAFALVTAARAGARLLAAAVVAAGATTVFSDAAWRGNWTWWLVVTGGTLAVVALARPPGVGLRGLMAGPARSIGDRAPPPDMALLSAGPR
jgi:hypothetical protein